MNLSKEIVKLRAEVKDLTCLTAVYASGNKELGDELTALSYPGFKRMGEILARNADKLKEHAQTRAETRRMYDRCDHGHNIRADLFGPDGECPECQESFRVESQLRRHAEAIRALPEDERNQFMKYLLAV